jgi:exodeoxyribonuclease V gamma subunit
LQRSDIIAPPDPVAALRELVGIRDAGLRVPLPLPTTAACEYAARRHRGDDVELAVEAAETSFKSDFGGEGQDVYVQYLYGGEFAAVLAERTHPGGRDTSPTEPTRFGALAAALWTPIFRAETVR